MSVQDGVNGFISPVGDAAAMARNLLKITFSATLREQMSRASLRRANEFTLHNMMRPDHRSLRSDCKAWSPVRPIRAAGS